MKMNQDKFNIFLYLVFIINEPTINVLINYEYIFVFL